MCALIGRPPSCACGDCRKCLSRVKSRERYQAMSTEERRAHVGRRDRKRVQAADRERHVKHHEKRLSAMRAYQATMRAAGRWIYYAESDPVKRAARVQFGNAVRDGRITREPCEVCGDPNAHGHHEDYAFPLVVVWLCSTHHGERHREINEQRREVSV